jgi:hypothetical protein
MNMPLHRPLTPFERQPGFHGIVVSFQALSKVLEFCYSVCFDRIEPGIQALSLSLPQHAGKVSDEVTRLLDLSISFTQLDQVLLLPIETLLFLKDDPMSHLRGCWRTLRGRFDRGLGGRITLFEGPGLVRAIASNSPHPERAGDRCCPNQP